MKKMKKVLVLAISLLMLSGMQGMDKVQAVEATNTAEEQQIPEGYTPIYDIADLYAIRNNPRSNYILMNDIDMTEATKEGGEWDQGNGWTPIESFSGIFDGNGYRISGMCIYGNISTYYVGLFGKLEDAEVKNLALVDININVRGIDVGGIAGNVSGSSIISSCYCSGEICSQKMDSYLSYTGGIVGYSYRNDKYIINCFNATEVSGQDYVGGILGFSYASRSYIQNCYNIGNIIGADNRTYAIGYSDDYYMSFTNNYYLKDSAPKGSKRDGAGECVLLTETQMKNAKAYTGFDFDTVWEVDLYCDSYPYPQLKNNRMVRVASIVLQSDPAKLVYNQGDKLEVSDTVLEITYEDGIKTTIPVTADMLSGYDMMEIGTQKVNINYGGAEASFDIEVKEIPVTGIMIPEKLSIQRSKEQKLELTILPENASDKSVEWESSDPAVASVDDTGLVKAKSKGTTVITVTSANGLKAECEVTVQVPAVSVKLNRTSLLLNKGESGTITAEVLPLESTDVVEWESSDELVAEVKDGIVEAKGAGKATVTAYTESGAEAKCEVIVKEVEVSWGNNGNTSPDNSNSNGNMTADASNVNSDKNKNEVEIKKVNAIKVKIKSAKNVKKKSIKLNLSGLSGCDGYQIEYSTNKKFKSAKKITKKSSTVTIKKLKNKKTYYVRARVYKKINGKTYYGKWSSKKSVKIRK